MQEAFRKLAEVSANAVGSYWSFLIALLVVGGWAISGPIFGYSDTWQLFINTGTTIITFLMVFLIQNSQNRDARIVGLKLDELIRAMKGARNSMVTLDDMTDAELETVQNEFKRLSGKYGVLLEDDLAHVEHELHTRKARRHKS